MYCIFSMFARGTTSVRRRLYSTLVKVSNADVEGVRVVSLNHGPVNSLDLATVESLAKEIETLNRDSSCRGLVLTSAVPKAFSAGVELTEFKNPEAKRLKTFWTAMQNLWAALYGSPLTTVAAINVRSEYVLEESDLTGSVRVSCLANARSYCSESVMRRFYDLNYSVVLDVQNHAIAGGCLLAVACDRRIMVKGSIGLNETKLGVTPPSWLSHRYMELVGTNFGAAAVECGLLFDATEALNIGLVDRVCDEENLMKTAVQEMSVYLSTPDFARRATKLECRREKLENFRQNEGKNLDIFTKGIFNPDAQKIIADYYAKLKKK